VELEPKDADNQLWLGIALERSGTLEEAVECYRASAAAAPARADAHEHLAQLYATNNRCDLAIPIWEKAVQAAPKVSRFRLGLADCKVRLRKYDDALRVYREILKQDPAEVAVHYKLARAIHEAQGPRAAFPYYEKAAVEEKANPMPHYYLGFAYKERGLKARAIAEFKRFLELKPDADEKRDIEAEIEDLGGGAAP
jgi:tetratricopeptide (TPR) repeat protein